MQEKLRRRGLNSIGSIEKVRVKVNVVHTLTFLGTELLLAILSYKISELLTTRLDKLLANIHVIAS